MRKYLAAVVVVFLFSLYSLQAHATVFGELQGIVHDSQHRPIAHAQVTVHADNSHFTQIIRADQNGYFSFPTLPLGNYIVSIEASGFDILQQIITVYSDSSPILHFQLQVGSILQSVRVSAQTDVVNGNSVTPATLINRQQIARTPVHRRGNCAIV